MIKKLLFLCMLLLHTIVVQAITAVGDTAEALTTFQFSVGAGIYDAANQQLWTLSGQDTSSFSSHIQSYGIAYTPFVSVDGSQNPVLTAYPYISTQATISSTDESGNFIAPSEFVANPLLGKAFNTQTFLGAYLTVVAASAPRYIYLIQSVYFDDGVLYGTSDSQGFSILNVLDLGATFQAITLAGSGLGTLFVAQTEGIFGTDSSNIAYIATSSTNSAIINGKSVSCVVMTQQANQSVTLNSSVLTAGGADLTAIGSSVFMNPSSTIAMQMYVGLDVSSAVTDGQAVGLFTVTAQAAQDQTLAAVNFGQVMPNSVAAAGLVTPVSVPADQRVVVANITTTQTSTGLSYIMTTGSNGIGQQSVYAMPMVTMATNGVDNGKIAQFDSVEQSFKIIGTTYRIQGFGAVIDNAEEINIAGSQTVISRLQVGGGPVPLAAGQTVQQLMAQGDAVYIMIQDPFAAGTTPGMFKSQALFDSQGRIMSWSLWQRVAGTDDQILFAVKNKVTDATMYVSGNLSNTIEQTTWNNTATLTSFIAGINAALPVVRGGVQALVPVSNQTPDVSNFSLAIATGNQAIVISQTGSLDNNQNLVIDTPQNTIIINAQQNLNIGSVVTATFAHDTITNNNWFFMGGDSGLAVLSDDTTGFAFNGQLMSLDQLTADGMSCKTLGNFKFIKKIINSGNFLYVLTINGVYQIALDANKFSLDNPAALNPQLVIGAVTIDGYASCLDMLVDNNFMLLGTTNGLYSLNLTGSLPASPQLIAIPGGLSAVCRLNTISNQANFNGPFYNSSNLYVLTINYAFEQARLNRFSITDGVVTPIQDQLLQGQNGPLLVFDYMSNNIFIDGSLGFATSYRIGQVPPVVKYLEYTLQAGKSSTQILLQAHTANISIAPILNSLGIAAIVRDYASGCLMLGFDYGLLTDS